MNSAMEKPCLFMVPYGQALHSEAGENKGSVLAWSPDRARPVTVKSQDLSLIEEKLAMSIEIGETCGQVPRSVPYG
jgi:hypothetical protein